MKKKHSFTKNQKGGYVCFFRKYRLTKGVKGFKFHAQPNILVTKHVHGPDFKLEYQPGKCQPICPVGWWGSWKWRGTLHPHATLTERIRSPSTLSDNSSLRDFEMGGT